MRIVQTRGFANTIKKFHKNQKKELDIAVKVIMEDPSIGEEKKGDLAGVQVYKFKMLNQLTLLSYIFDEDAQLLTLLSIGSHQNFYRDLKRH